MIWVGGRPKARVLALTDLTDVDPVLDQALLTAQALGGEVVVVHALSLGSEDMPAAYARAVATCETAAARSPLISKTFVIRFEDPVNLLKVSADELGATLVVLGAQAGPGSVIRGALRECAYPLWLARGNGRIDRIAAPSGLSLVDQLGAGLGAAVVPEGEAGPSDLRVVDTRGLSVLSRLDRVRSVWSGSSPLLIWPSRKASPIGNVR